MCIPYDVEALMNSNSRKDCLKTEDLVQVKFTTQDDAHGTRMEHQIESLLRSQDSNLKIHNPPGKIYENNPFL